MAGRDSGEFFLFMNFELLTFPCREMIKLSIHNYMTCFQNESISIQKPNLFGVMLALFIIDIAKLQMRFLHYAFFLAKSRVSVPFSWPFVGRIE